MKKIWNSIWGNLLMDQVTEGGTSGGTTTSFLTPSKGGSTAAANTGDGNPPPGNPANNTANATATSNTTTASGVPDWRSSLPKELQEDANLKKFTDVSTLAKSYVNAQKLIGANKIPVPTKHTTDEEWQGVYKSLGLPEKLEEYQVKFKEGVSIDDKFGNDFRAAAHKAGVLPKQAQALADWFSDINLSAEQSVEKDVLARYNTGVNDLKKEWGNSYDLQISRAKKVADEMGGPELVEYFNKIGMGGDKNFIKLLAKVGETMFAEHKFVEAQGGAGTMSPDDLDKEIRKLSSDPAYFDKLHPSHKSIVKEVSDLYAKRYPSKQTT